MKSWKDAVLKETATIKDAIVCLNFVAVKIILVVDENDKFIGTVSDGDIRRALIGGLGIDQELLTIANKTPVIVGSSKSKDELVELMVQKKVQQIPQLDSKGKIIALHLWDEVSFSQRIENSIVIMAGGFGKRLRPYTEEIPKPMIMISGKPILERIIRRAKRQGFYNFIISLCYKGQIIKDYLGDGASLGVNIRYIEEQEPLGTAGALSLIDDFGKIPFIVTNGDILTEVNFDSLLSGHSKNSADATMVVRLHEWQNPFGVVKLDNLMRIVGFDEKPIVKNYINSGIYVINPDCLDYLKKNTRCDMPDFFNNLIENKKNVFAQIVDEDWMDVGTPYDLQIAIDKTSAENII